MTEFIGQVGGCKINFLNNILPKKIMECLYKTNIAILNELRIRVGQPLLAKYSYKQSFVGENGCTEKIENAFYPSYEDVQSIVFLACNKSVYAYTEQLLNGFVVLENGARMGVCGCVVCDKDKAIGIKDFSGLCIRIPHQIYGCSNAIKKFFLSPLKSVLIASKPAAGKTTMLRDMLFQTRNMKINTMVIDERREICGITEKGSPYKISNTCDILCDGNKNFALEWGIRGMAPDLIVCDELFECDMQNIKTVSLSGVKIFASVHADSVDNAIERLALKHYKNIFDLIVVLNDKNGPGTIESVVDIKINEKLL